MIPTPAKGCFACQGVARPPPDDDRGAFTVHVLAMVGNVGEDVIVAHLCPKHKGLYDDMMTVGAAIKGGVRA
jgi:hypothetical protein